MDVFVYGTLTEPERVREVVDSFVFVGPATLSGLHLVEGQYPTLAPGGETAGRLLRTDAVDALDDYERVADGLYVRVLVPLVMADADTSGSAAERETTHPEKVAVYVGNPERLDADANWPGEGSFRERVERVLAEASPSVHVRVERER
ncbi:hypothetical protein JCM17823_13930 [Halorubrum gandharaense]